MKDNGSLLIQYVENNEIAWTTQMTTYDIETGSVPDCLCWETEDGETCFDCPTHESVLTASQACDNLVQPELCDGKDQCHKDGLSDDPADIVNLHPFPYLPFKLMVVGDSISHGMESDWVSSNADSWPSSHHSLTSRFRHGGTDFGSGVSLYKKMRLATTLTFNSKHPWL